MQGQAQLILKDGLSYLQEGNVDKADVLFAKAYSLDPKNCDTLNLLGIREYQKQNYQEAIRFFSAAHNLYSQSAQTLNNLGLAHNAIGDFQKALEFFDLSIAIDSNVPEAHNNRGNSLRELHKHSLAVDAYSKALHIRPQYAEAVSNLGVIFLEEKNCQVAIEYFEKAIQLNPNLASAYNSLGNAYTATNQYESAFRAFNHALEINPQYLDACLNFGISLKKAKQYEESIKCLEYAVATSPDHAQTYFLLGEVFFDSGDAQAADINFRKYQGLDPKNISAQFALTIAQIPKVLSGENELAQSRVNFYNELKKLRFFNVPSATPEHSAINIGRHPFYLAYHEELNTSLLNQYGDICIDSAKPIQDILDKTQLISNKYNRKIQIGIVGHYFCDHPVWHAITKGWIKHLNPKIFEIHIFNTNGLEDEETELAKNTTASYLNSHKSTLDLATQIRNKQLDILLYPEVGMDATSKALACLRLSPTQVASWGHPETTGLSTIDYFLSGESFEPANAQDNYREKLITLPGLGTYFELEAAIESADINLTKLGIDPNRPILLCAGSPSKYNPSNDEIFIEIALRLGDCQFIFFSFQKELTEILKNRLFGAFLKANLQPEHFIKFIPFLKRNEFNGLMQKSDLYLDTIGFSGFNTAMQAISCNLPIIAKESLFMRGRLGNSILKKLQLEELVSVTNSGYVEKVISSIQNKGRRQHYKDHIAKYKMQLFNDAEPIIALEQLLIQLYSHHRGN